MNLSEAPDDRTRAEPLVEEPERLLPRISILSLIGLITGCAAIFWAVRTGFQGNFIGLKSLVVIVCLVFACFVAYASLFSVTYLFSLILRPLVAATGQSLERKRAALPTQTLPTQSAPTQSAPTQTGEDTPDE